MTPNDRDVLIPFLQVQKRVDTILDVARRRYAHRVSDLSYANPYDGPDPEVRAAMRAVLDADPPPLQLQYTPFGGRPPARRAAAQRLATSHGLAYEWEDVVLTAGAMAALAITFRCAYEQTGDQVLVVTPCWHDYPAYLAAIGLEPVFVPIVRESSEVDCNAIRAALACGRVVAVVLSQPANPTGMLYSEDNMRALAAVLAAADRPPLLISDEAHREVLFGATMVAPAAYYDRTVTLHSFGKSLMIQGQRIGYVAVSPRHPERRALASLYTDACRFMGMCTPTALMQHALPTLLRHQPRFERVRQRRDRITAALQRNGYEIAPGAHTFFVYVRSPLADDFALVAALAEEGLLVLPGSLFHDPGYFRISVTGTDEMVETACTILDRWKPR